MGLYQMGAASSANRETHILELKAYLNTTNDYNSLIALQKAHLYSWTTFLSYLRDIKQKYASTLSQNGKNNMQIAEREAKLLKKVNARAKLR